jgi:septal ring factor EnvC (AmiA/AmiB activator)
VSTADLKSPIYWWILGMLASVCGFAIAERTLDFQTQLRKAEERISQLEREHAQFGQHFDRLTRDIDRANAIIQRNTELINRYVLPMERRRQE